jgi:hypothetical protein
MNHHWIQTCALAVVVTGLVAPVAAQKLPIGAEAPSLDVKEAFNDGPTSWGDLEGRAILVKFTRTW